MDSYIFFRASSIQFGVAELMRALPNIKSTQAEVLLGSGSAPNKRARVEDENVVSQPERLPIPRPLPYQVPPQQQSQINMSQIPLQHLLPLDLLLSPLNISLRDLIIQHMEQTILNAALSFHPYRSTP